MSSRTVTAKAASCVIDTLGANETPAIKIRWKLNGEAAHRTSTHWLTDGALPYTIKALRAAGFAGNDLMQLAEVTGVECAKLLPLDVELVLETVRSQTDSEKEFEEVKYVNESGGAPVLQSKNAPTGGKLAELRLKFKNAAAAEAHASTGAKPAQKQLSSRTPDPDPTNGEFDEDDFAF